MSHLGRVRSFSSSSMWWPCLEGSILPPSLFPGAVGVGKSRRCSSTCPEAALQWCPLCSTGKRALAVTSMSQHPHLSPQEAGALLQARVASPSLEKGLGGHCGERLGGPRASSTSKQPCGVWDRGWLWVWGCLWGQGYGTRAGCGTGAGCGSSSCSSGSPLPAAATSEKTLGGPWGQQ